MVVYRKYKLPKLTSEETENLSRSVVRDTTGNVVKELSNQ